LRQLVDPSRDLFLGIDDTTNGPAEKSRISD